MDVEGLAEDVVSRAKTLGLTVFTAESCSAGRLGLALSQADGASRVLLGGVIAYTKDMKVSLLRVPPSSIERGTAVCAEVARAMAKGALACSGADLGVSITGVAGPEPDEDGNPVGLVYCGVARRDGLTNHIELRCEGSEPDRIIDQACREALILLRSACTQGKTRQQCKTMAWLVS